MMDKRTVAVFRLQLFKPSETFITNQAHHFQQYRPIYWGRKLFGPPPQGAQVAVPKIDTPIGVGAAVLLRRVSAFAKALDRRPDLIHAHFAVDAVYAMNLARDFKCPLVTTMHGFDVTSSNRALLLSGRPALANAVLFRRELQRRGDLFICVSEFLRRVALSKGYPAERTIVHHVGIDTGALTPRSDFGEPGLIVHVARLVEVKGTVYLIRALQRILAQHPAAKLVIIGDGPLRTKLEEEARTLGLGESIVFTGVLPNSEVLGWIRKASVVVVPSVALPSGYAEGFGIVNLEAGALGVPVVGSNSGGIGEAVVDGETGFLVPERDVAALADKIGSLIADPGLGKTLGLRARRRIERAFDIRSQSERLEKLYGAVLASKGSRAT
jgi:glycosyltransferase involved in cell wall biosynthesis